jgi:hypothetical protein
MKASKSVCDSQGRDSQEADGARTLPLEADERKIQNASNVEQDG